MWDRISAAQEQTTSYCPRLQSRHPDLQSICQQSILVATDLCGPFEQPIRRAVLLAKQHGLRMTVLHVVDRELPAHTAGQLIFGAKEAIRTCLQSMPEMDAGPADPVVMTGEIAQAIVEQAARRDCGLILLGAHHMAAAGHLHCCTMERVVQATRLPVLTVQTDAAAPYRSVVAAVDFSKASRLALQSALRLNPAAQFRCIHAYSLPLLRPWARTKTRQEVQSEAQVNFAHLLQHELAADLAQIQLEPEAISCVCKEGYPLDVIDEEVQVSKPDLLALGVHDGMALRDRRLGSVSLAFLNFPPCDVLFQSASI